LIDAIRFKAKISETVGVLTKSVMILKVVESQAILEKLVTEFNCHTLNVILAHKPVETQDCYSTVLIKQDYRIRPLTKLQFQIFAHTQKEFLLCVVNLFESTKKTNDIHRLI